MDLPNEACRSKLKPPVILTGTAKKGGAGPSIGVVDIGISDDSYFFRMALPGIRRNESKLKCEIQRDGTICIQGVVTPGGGIAKHSPSLFQMRVQQLCPPGPFTISFQLPGPVDPRLTSSNFRADGILEVVVMKCREPKFPWTRSSPTS